MLLEGIIFFSVFFVLFALFLTVACRDASHFNGVDPIADASFAHAFFTRLYFSITTFSTIGFGDVSPASIRARLIIIITIFFFIVLVLKSLDTMRVNLLASLNPIAAKLDEKLAPKKKDTPPHTTSPDAAAATATVATTPPPTSGGDTNMYYVSDGGLTTGSLTYMLPNA